MADSLERMRRDLAELRQDVVEMLVESALPGDVGISLEAFARLVGLAPITLQRDLRSADPAVRGRWPTFYRPTVSPKAAEHTTVDDLRRWRRARCRSTAAVDPEVLDRLNGGGRRAMRRASA